MAGQQASPPSPASAPLADGIAPSDTVRYLTVALEADASGREALWKSAAASGTSDEALLRVALMQSIPGHTGYDPVVAREKLQQLASRSGAAERVTSVARLRLAQLQSDAQMATELAQLRQRLARVVEIEKRQNGAVPPPGAPPNKDFVKESVK